MADERIYKNYTIVELLHLSYLFRDSYEYVHPQVQVTKENFDRRKGLSENILKEGNFIQRWFENHPNEEVKKFYDDFSEYFASIYQQEGFVSYETLKVDPEKSVDFIEQTARNYQISEDILFAFYTEYKKDEKALDPRIDKCVLASMDYYRVIVNWVLFNEIIRNDSEYKKALQASDNKPSYEVNYNLNILKRLIGAFNFMKDKYAGDKVDIKNMIADSFMAFKALDGTMFRDYEEANPGEKLTNEQRAAMAKEAIEKAANDCAQAIRLYEQIWRETYQHVSEFMNENPLTADGTPAQQA